MSLLNSHLAHTSHYTTLHRNSKDSEVPCAIYDSRKITVHVIIWCTIVNVHVRIAWWIKTFIYLHKMCANTVLIRITEIRLRDLHGFHGNIIKNLTLLVRHVWIAPSFVYLYSKNFYLWNLFERVLSKQDKKNYSAVNHQNRRFASGVVLSWVFLKNIYFIQKEMSSNPKTY